MTPAELVDSSLLEGGVSQKDIKHTMQDNTVKSNVIPINLPLEAVVTQLQPDDDPKDDKPLCETAKTKEQVEWEWMQKFTEEPLKECALVEDGKVSIDFGILFFFQSIQ